MQVPVWDAPTRLFHWALAILAVLSFTTGKLGGSWMGWHVKSGYAILALLLFRVAWGFVGSDTARFTHFLRGARAATAYARQLLAGSPPSSTGHNPLGGWMVVLMLAVLLLQAATGLFADDEVRAQGPLAVVVSETTVRQMTRIHSFNEWVVAGLVVVHVVAIGVYQWGLRRDLIGPMLRGTTDAPDAPRVASAWVAAAILALAALAVYYLVVIFPRP